MKYLFLAAATLFVVSMSAHACPDDEGGLYMTMKQLTNKQGNVVATLKCQSAEALEFVEQSLRGRSVVGIEEKENQYIIQMEFHPSFNTYLPIGRPSACEIF